MSRKVFFVLPVALSTLSLAFIILSQAPNVKLPTTITPEEYLSLAAPPTPEPISTKTEVLVATPRTEEVAPMNMCDEFFMGFAEHSGASFYYIAESGRFASASLSSSQDKGAILIEVTEGYLPYRLIQIKCEKDAMTVFDLFKITIAEDGNLIVHQISNAEKGPHTDLGKEKGDNIKGDIRCTYVAPSPSTVTVSCEKGQQHLISLSLSRNTKFGLTSYRFGQDEEFIIDE